MQKIKKMNVSFYNDGEYTSGFMFLGHSPWLDKLKFAFDNNCLVVDSTSFPQLPGEGMIYENNSFSIGENDEDWQDVLPYMIENNTKRYALVVENKVIVVYAVPETNAFLISLFESRPTFVTEEIEDH
jgi:hypothetical protein